MNKSAKLVVDKTKCQGHAMCVRFSSSLFMLDDNGYNVMESMPLLTVEEYDAALMAVGHCPEGAIEILKF